MNVFRFELRYFDPFLVLDEFSGRFCFVSLIPLFLLCSFESNLSEINYRKYSISVSAPSGFPDHPHRGWFSHGLF